MRPGKRSVNLVGSGERMVDFRAPFILRLVAGALFDIVVGNATQGWSRPVLEQARGDFIHVLLADDIQLAVARDLLPEVSAGAVVRQGVGIVNGNRIPTRVGIPGEITLFHLGGGNRGESI